MILQLRFAKQFFHVAVLAMVDRIPQYKNPICFIHFRKREFLYPQPRSIDNSNLNYDPVAMSDKLLKIRL